MVGDGGFLMLHSELVTSLQEGKKINVLLFDNCGFGCINNLQMSNGIGNLATEFRYRDEKGGLNGGLMPIDFAAVAAGYGKDAGRTSGGAYRREEADRFHPDRHQGHPQDHDGRLQVLVERGSCQHHRRAGAEGCL